MLRLVISGKQRAGKNAAAEYISKMLSESYSNLHIVEMAFADPIVESEQATQKAFGLPITKQRSYRTTIGRWAREQDPNIFVKVLENKLKLVKDVIVTDARF